MPGWVRRTHVVAVAGVLFFSLLPVTLAQVPSGKIQGQVETEDGLPLRQALLLLVGPEGEVQAEATSNERGSYQFPQLAGGTYRVEVSAEGYITQAREQLLLNGGESLEVDFRLQTERTTLREVEERGAEERNPNIFIRRIDNVALRSPLTRRGIDPEFLQLSSAENQYGTDMGAPV